MLAAILFFGLGYFVGFFHSSSAYKTHVDLKYADKVLVWHTDALGWRPVLNRQNLSSGKKYLLAFEVYKDKQEQTYKVRELAAAYYLQYVKTGDLILMSLPITDSSTGPEKVSGLILSVFEKKEPTHYEIYAMNDIWIATDHDVKKISLETFKQTSFFL